MARRWRVLLGGVLAVLAGLAGGAAWLGSAQGLSWLLQRPWIEARTGLRAQDLRGSLWKELRVGSLAWSDGAARLSAQQVLLRWRPGALLSAHPRLQVDRLEAQRLDWQSATSRSGGSALQIPARLRPPLPLRIERLRIARLRVHPTGAGPWRDLGALQGSLGGDTRQWQLQLSARGAWGALRAGGEISTRAPFDLRGALDGQLLAQQRTVRLRAHVGGHLARLRLRVEARALQARARADVDLQPFDPAWLGPTRIRVDQLDPRNLDASWPQAMLALQAELHQAAGGVLQGSVQVRNAQPGAIDARRLPLQGLQAQVRLQDGVLRAESLHAELSGGARVDGSLRWSLRGGGGAQLQVHALDLRALYARLVRTRLDGRVDLQGSATSQQVRASLTQPGWVVALQAGREGSRIEVHEARLQARGASLRLSGRLDTEAAQDFRVDAALHDFQPQRFGDWPRAQLNLQLQAHGALRARQATFALRVRPSRWRSRVFEGRASGRVAPGAVQGLRADLRLGDNRLQAQGDFGRPSDRLHLSLRAPALAQFGEGWGGSLQAVATLRGGLGAPAGKLSLRATDLRGPRGVRIARLDADGMLQGGPQGPIDARLQARDLRVPGLALQQAALRIDGTLHAHRLRLSLRDSPHLDLSAQADGSWQPGKGWSGRIDTLDNTAPYALHLLRPALLQVGLDGDVVLRDARLRSDAGTVDLHSLRRAGAVWSSQGSAQDLDPARWARMAGIALHGVRSDLRLRASWQLRTGPDPQLRLQLARSAGDVSLPGEPGLALGLSRLQLGVEAAQGRVRAVLDAAGAHLGRLHADAAVPLTHRAKGWGVAGDAPLQGSASLDVPDLSWVSSLLPQAARVAGSLRGELQVGGAVDAPRLNGKLDASALALALPGLGLDLREGALAAVFSGDRVELRSLRMQDARGGTLRAAGSLRLVDGKPLGSVRADLGKLQVLDRPGQQVQLSGQATLNASAAQLGVESDLLVDKADIELAGGTGAQLADDVVVQGRVAAAPRSAGPPVHARVHIDLGRHFHVSGQGVDARLGGRLLVRADPAQPLRAEGSIVVRSGTYGAYGQSLQLVPGGSVNFSGPVDNPGLNLAAQREGLPVQVGVRIAGTLRAPMVSLTSTPAMPDSAILSWLVLGQDPSTVAADQTSLLQVAGAALLSRGQGASPTGRLAGALGLDELKVSGDSSLQSTVVTVGKKLSSRLSVSVERGLSAAGSLFNVRYAFTKRLSLRLQSGTDNAVDVFYTFSFD